MWSDVVVWVVEGRETSFPLGPDRKGRKVSHRLPFGPGPRELRVDHRPLVVWNIENRKVGRRLPPDVSVKRRDPRGCLYLTLRVDMVHRFIFRSSL